MQSSLPYPITTPPVAVRLGYLCNSKNIFVHSGPLHQLGLHWLYIIEPIEQVKVKTNIPVYIMTISPQTQGQKRNQTSKTNP